MQAFDLIEKFFKTSKEIPLKDYISNLPDKKVLDQLDLSDFFKEEMFQSTKPEENLSKINKEILDYVVETVKDFVNKPLNRGEEKKVDTEVSPDQRLSILKSDELFKSYIDKGIKNKQAQKFKEFKTILEKVFNNYTSGEKISLEKFIEAVQLNTTKVFNKSMALFILHYLNREEISIKGHKIFDFNIREITLE